MPYGASNKQSPKKNTYPDGATQRMLKETDEDDEQKNKSAANNVCGAGCLFLN